MKDIELRLIYYKSLYINTAVILKYMAKLMNKNESSILDLRKQEF